MRECEKCKGNGYLIVGADKYGTRKTVRCPVCKGHGLIFEESPKDFVGVDLGNGWSIQAGKRTRADKIRAMSDEELTEFIDHITLACYSCAQDKAYGMKVDESKPHCIFGRCTGKKEIAEWLKQEAEE